MSFISKLQLPFIVVLLLLWNPCTCTSSTQGFKTKQSGTKAELYPFQNISLSWDERVNDLVSRLTLEELQEQLARGGRGHYGTPAPPIPRLGIGPYTWDTECLRGDAIAPGNATAFPQAIGLAAAFSPDLMGRVAEATGREVRGKHNDFVRQGIYVDHTGASCFSPVINIVRDPRWGRIQETYGEDPFLTGVLAQSFVKGLQGNDDRYIQASAGCKHFDAYAGPEDIPVSRMSFDAKVSELDLRMTFLPAFKKCVEAGTFSFMCSYNSVNGVPACANKELLTDILRTEWGFKGYVVSDDMAIENIISAHHYLNNSVDTAAACVNAGTNLELSFNLKQPVYLSIVEAVKQGKLSEDVVRERAKPLFYTRMRIGEFDPPDKNPFSRLDSSVVESGLHQALAVEAAIKSFVLLKNKDGVLPLKPDNYKNVAMIGPMSDNVEQLFGDYSPQQSRSFTKTPLQGIQSLFKNVRTGKACQNGTSCTKYDYKVVNKVVTGADLVFVALGTGQAVESEAHDRPSVDLPMNQTQLLLETMYATDGNATIIVLLFSAGPLNVTIFDQSPMIDAILECFFPAQATGEALASVLINRDGQSSPGGRLPVTWPLLDSEIPPMVNYSMAGRTYRYMTVDPQYPFGYGLSYSNFHYDQLEIQFSGNPKENLRVSLQITNVGQVDADEVVQCYLEWESKELPVPVRQLVYFDRFHISVGSPMKLDFTISWENWVFWYAGKWVIEAGQMTLYCGGQQPKQRKTVPSNVVSKTFTIVASATVDKI